MLTESLALRQAQFGKSHPSSADSLLRLSALRVAQRRCGEAVPLSREALATTRRFLPERHALTAPAALGLANRRGEPVRVANTQLSEPYYRSSAGRFHFARLAAAA